MNGKKCIKILLLLFLVIISNILILRYCNLDKNKITLSFNLKSAKENTYQMYYGNIEKWSEDKSTSIIYKGKNEEKNMKYSIPEGIDEFGLKLGNNEETIILSDFKMSFLGKQVKLNTEYFLQDDNHFGMEKVDEKNGVFYAENTDQNSFLKYKLDSSTLRELNIYRNKINMVLKLGICILFDLLVVAVFKKSRSVIQLFQEVTNNKVLIWNLSKNDFKTKYAGSYLGIVWAFIQPIITIMVYWIVFEFGLKAGAPMQGVPFIIWFMAGMIPWFFFQEALLNATNCMVEYSYLVKKVVFKISILPIVKIISSLFVHLVFIVFLFVVATIYGFYPTRYTIQLIYYSFCIFFLVLAISYATSAIVIFFKDLGQLIGIFLQVGTWITPIMWSYTIVPEKFQWIVKLNPMYYIVEGYRDTIINKVWFFQRYFQTAYFWIITLGLFVIGATIFKKLKPHFADVL